MTNTSGPGDGRTARIAELCQELLRQRQLILASNRGPVEHQMGPDGQIQVRRGSGGVVTALSSLHRNVRFTWVSSAMGEGDRRVTQNSGGNHIPSPLPGHNVDLRYVVTPRRVYHKYYNILCNPLLWFLQHYMWSSPYTPNVDSTVHDAWETGYIPVNQAFAEAVVDEARKGGRPAVVLLHDYHLYMTPAFVRRELPDALIQHFIHIPWPDPVYWQLLPWSMGKGICESLCQCSIVGFQTRRDLRNFLQTCEAFLPEAQVDHVASTVLFQGRRVQVRAYPISIDVEEMHRIANSPRSLEHEQHLKALCGSSTVVRVDRAEPSKNIIRGLHAFHLLLERHPELVGQVRFLAFLVPSRTHIKQYQRYLEEIEALIQQVNTTFGREGWQPITAFFENNYTQAIAGMRLYDVLLVNSVIDGMNLVAKEGPVVNTRDGTLVLSYAAGAYEQLQEGCLAVAPADIQGTMEALYQAITMDPSERRRRAALLRQAIAKEDIHHWLLRQLEDLRALID